MAKRKKQPSVEQHEMLCTGCGAKHWGDGRISPFCDWCGEPVIATGKARTLTLRDAGVE